MVQPPPLAASGTPPIGIAMPAHATRLNALLVRAFDVDPLTCWFVRDDDQRPQRMQRVFAWYLRLALPLGHSHATQPEFVAQTLQRAHRRGHPWATRTCRR